MHSSTLYNICRKKLTQNDKPSHSLQARIHVFHHPFQPTTRIPDVDALQSSSSYQTGTSQPLRSGPMANSHLPHKHTWQSGAALLMQQTLEIYTQIQCNYMIITSTAVHIISNDNCHYCSTTASYYYYTNKILV